MHILCEAAAKVVPSGPEILISQRVFPLGCFLKGGENTDDSQRDQ